MQPDAEPDFYLSSSEHRGDLARIRACWQRARLSGPNNAEFLLVSVDPPIIGQAFGLGGSDIATLVLSPHYQGDSLFPVRRYPTPVFVYRVRNSDILLREQAFQDSDVELIAWGEIYQTEAAARIAQQPNAEN